VTVASCVGSHDKYTPMSAALLKPAGRFGATADCSAHYADNLRDIAAFMNCSCVRAERRHSGGDEKRSNWNELPVRAWQL